MSTAQQFKAKPHTVEAVFFGAYTEALGPAPWNGAKGGRVFQWLREQTSSFYVNQEDNGPAYLTIVVPGKVTRVDVGDWIVKDDDGNLRQCDSTLFRNTYELIDADA